MVKLDIPVQNPGICGSHIQLHLLSCQSVAHLIRADREHYLSCKAIFRGSKKQV